MGKQSREVEKYYEVQFFGHNGWKKMMLACPESAEQGREWAKSAADIYGVDRVRLVRVVTTFTPLRLLK